MRSREGVDLALVEAENSACHDAEHFRAMLEFLLVSMNAAHVLKDVARAGHAEIAVVFGALRGELQPASSLFHLAFLLEAL